MNPSYRDIIADKLKQLKEQGNYRYFQDVNKSARHFPRFYFHDLEGVRKSAVNWCSNDYLGMSIHEEVISKLSFIAHQSGVGSGGTRNISGTTNYHQQLEHCIASLHNKESAIIFNSAFLANLSALATLGNAFPETVFLSDERNHASIIEGIKSSRCKKVVFKHNDVAHLEEILRAIPPEQPKIIVFESIYSISGNIAPVQSIVALAKKYYALTYADEVHAVGLYGTQGAGIISQENLGNSVDFINGTFAKAFGTLGGYIATSTLFADYLRSFASGFIFTTSLPPAICSATVKSIELVKNEPAHREQFHKSVQSLRKYFTDFNIPFHINHSHITTVPVGDSKLCKRIADELLHQYGVYLQPINPPTVKSGEACLRIIATAKHTKHDMLHLTQSLSKLLHETL